MNRVIYTTNFGSYDSLIEPRVESKDCKCICFADKKINSNIWEIRKIDIEQDLGKDLSLPRANRKMKILTHRYLKEYEESLYLDGNCKIMKDVSELFDKYLTNNNWGVFEHPWRDCIYAEGKDCKHKENTDSEVIEKQLNKYRSEDYPKNNGLVANTYILRKHNEPSVIEIAEQWWKEIKEYSYRDQISFNYIAWKNDFKWIYFEEDWSPNKYFKRTKHGESF